MHDTPSNDAIDILLVEDTPDDVQLIQEGLKTTKREITLHTVSSGDNAVEFLQQSTGNPLPDLVLLDLNLPGRDGCGVLGEIRKDPQLKPLPVIMLASSETDEDIARCYDARANAYLTKPIAPDALSSLMDSLERFWFEQAQLP
ncbi:response regulator receiver protein (plasmid) [Haloterrigena turkmenica DSM 5511]|uniref:Response regulator receiver protein n=1 Tax=Haloterrigena turkmenica (strain ATCC 51198 / DSM 5511 / JCM 9101 / NCIMB 13204 / VKM B-1734 / 4k) TaxID=543526 RepID=D2S1S7_HALTV|nr:response regulator [Haloterrigena turkmenica]ADB63324.1 response regulator receiver protein [Haloterrigena turkmenica DSM 5511]